MSGSGFGNAPAWSMGIRSESKMKQQLIAPGPGNYDAGLPTGKTPAWKIGNSLRNAQHDTQSPGPNYYNVQTSMDGPKITVGTRDNAGSHPDNHMPGPGNYNVSDAAIRRNPSGFTMGAKYSSGKVEDPEPGPGTYNTSTDGKKVGAKIGSSTRYQKDGNTQIPGPGHYNPSGQYMSFAPKHGFGNESKSMTGFEQMPGPGQYDAHQGAFGGIKGCTIGQKIGRKSETNFGTPGPGCYDTISKRPQSGGKIGRAKRNNFSQNYCPGPGAYQTNGFSKNPGIKMKTGLRSGMQRPMTPGPGAYDINNDYRKGITISGFKGKQTIDVSPGPGAYEVAGVGSRPYSAKIGKSLRSDNVASSNPGPGQYYPHEPTNCKFAYTKETRSMIKKSEDPGPGHYRVPPTLPSAPHYILQNSVYKSYGRT